MQPVIVLVVALSSQGHWFGGATGIIEMQWAVRQPMPPTVLEWTLALDRAVVATGESAFSPQGAPVALHLAVPDVRVSTKLHWEWRLRDAVSGVLLGRGIQPVHVYPDDLLSHWKRRLTEAGVRLVVVDAREGIPSLLARHDIPHVAVSEVDGLAGAADLVIVGRGQLAGEPAAAEALLRAARAGARVFVLEQPGVASLAGRPVRSRSFTADLDWRPTHPLLRGLGSFGPSSLPATAHPQVTTLSLPADGSTEPIACWPAGRSVECLVATRSLGVGAVTWCQLPVGPWSEDPRTTLLIDNALEHLLASSAAGRP